MNASQLDLFTAPTDRTTGPGPAWPWQKELRYWIGDGVQLADVEPWPPFQWAKPIALRSGWICHGRPHRSCPRGLTVTNGMSMLRGAVDVEWRLQKAAR